MTNFELISDLHKDARGFRPSQGWMEIFNGQSDVAQLDTWDALTQEMDDREADEARQELDAQREYETRIGGMVADYDITRADAVRWDAEAFDLDMDSAIQYHGSATQEIEFFLFRQGIAARMYPMYVAEISATYRA
jgi:hypothetical protein